MLGRCHVVLLLRLRVLRMLHVQPSFPFRKLHGLDGLCIVASIHESLGCLAL